MRLVRFDELSPSKDQREGVACGEPSLDRWLATQAGQSMKSRDAITYVLVDEERDAIAGYFCLSSGQVAREVVPEQMAQRAPQPIPAIRMGRFAVDRRYQGQGWELSFSEKPFYARFRARLVGSRVMLVDAISDKARLFYLRFGFEQSPVHPVQLLYDLRVVAASAARISVGKEHRSAPAFTRGTWG